jgi:2-keto-4-pentenoate hydratase/2-oxohepta-3-ene-1,7-dioic acid hydratase in catechol pathway
MQLVTFTQGKEPTLGAWVEDTILDFSSAGFPATMLAFIEAGPELWRKAGSQLKSERFKALPLSTVKLCAPISNPSKIIGIGLNYADHCREQNFPIPSRPLVFAKFPFSIIGPGDKITWDTTLTQQVDYEVELAVMIGREARHVEPEAALDYIFGYTILNDISARDLQFTDKQWVRGKSLDTFCPIGPVVVTSDGIPDPQSLRLRCWVNHELRQDSSTAQMIFSIRHLVSFLSQSVTLKPGDMIATGTPNGVGVFRKPPIFLKDKDVVSVEIEKIGRLENSIELESKG